MYTEYVIYIYKYALVIIFRTISSIPCADLHPGSALQSARWLLNATLSDFSPYRALTTMALQPLSLLNLGLSSVYIISLFRAVIYALIIFAAITLRALSAAMVSAIHTFSRNTTLAYVTVGGTSVMCPPAASCAFWGKSFIFTSKMIWHWTN